MENLIMLRYTDDGYSTVHGGTKYFVKNCLDPVTDVILSQGDVSSDEELVSIGRDIFGYKFRQNPEIFRRDFLKNSPAEGLHPLKYCRKPTRFYSMFTYDFIQCFLCTINLIKRCRYILVMFLTTNNFLLFTNPFNAYNR